MDRMKFKKKTKPAPLPYGRVARLWDAATVFCLASGPSLTPTDVARVRGVGGVIAVKDAIVLAPWADVLYACDAKWWAAHPETVGFAGPKYGLEHPKDRPDVTVLKHTGPTGLETNPEALRTGQNSGYQAINLAVHLGARRIVLLGYDMKAGPKGEPHFFGAHPYAPCKKTLPPFAYFLTLFPEIVAPLKGLGIEVLNATPGSRLSCFPRVTLDEAFGAVAA